MNSFIENESYGKQEIRNSLLSLNFKLQKWKKSAFNLLFSLYLHNLSEKVSKFYTVLFYLQNFVILIQVASIIWTSNLNIKGWDDYQAIWTAFKYSRLDIWA